MRSQGCPGPLHGTLLHVLSEVHVMHLLHVLHALREHSCPGLLYGELLHGCLTRKWNKAKPLTPGTPGICVEFHMHPVPAP